MGVALVTGAGRGLGRATARRLAEDGHRLVCVDLDGDAAQSAADEVGGTAHRCDVSDKEAVEALAGAVGTIDILINNAGIWRFGPLLSMSVEDTQAVLGVNLLGPLYCSQAFVPGMAEAGGGAIVNLSSAAAATRSPGIGIYPVTKGAIETLTKQMSLEWGPLGIRVNAVGPGLIVTEGTAHNYEGEARVRRAQTVPLRRIGDPPDIAAAVAFLVSADASYISGQVLYVDGAVTAGQLAR
jgi:3-oxoacyl-[acyl-carrier protein] reductase